MRMPPKKKFLAALSATIILALCCFTPILSFTLLSIGLGVLVPHLDFVLFPALVVLLVITVLSYKKWKQGDKTATLTCPKCKHKQLVAVPTEKCLPFYHCDGCKETVGIPPESKNCCVVCEYSDTACPLGHKAFLR